MLEAVGGYLVAFCDQSADPLGVNGCQYRRDGKGCFEVVALQHNEQCGEALIGPKLSLWRGQISGSDAVRAACEAQIDGDSDAATGTFRPANFVVGQALLVRDRVALFPGHASLLLRLKRPASAAEIFRGTSAPPLR